MNFLAGTINALVLAGMAAIGSYQIKDVQARGTTPAISKSEFHCLQQNIYFEARDQSELGQRAVAWVTLNRMAHKKYPNTICKVVWQRKQFSWTHDGKKDEPGKNVLEQRAWEKAGDIARMVLNRWYNNGESPVNGAIMFHADYVNPYWNKKYKRVTKIDDHIFYK